MYIGDTVFFRLQGIVKSTVSGVFEDLRLKFRKTTSKIEVVLAPRAESGQLQFWSELAEILNLRSSNTPELVAFTIP